MFDEIRFGQRQFVVRRLQTPIVQESDLNGCIDREGSAKKAFDSPPGPFSVIGRTNGDHVLIDGLASNGGDDVHSVIGRERRASRQGKR